MYKMLSALMLAALLLPASYGLAQDVQKDKGHFIEDKNEYWEEIDKGVNKFKAKEPEKPNLRFKMDFSHMDLPKTTGEFKQQWHNPPISQGSTGTCWCFSTTSFLESEIFRLNNKKVKLSEMYTVYWEYVEKVKRYVEERGNSVVGEGSQANAVTRTWNKYGVVPEDAFNGKLGGQEFYDHSALITEINNYLNSVKESNAWNEDLVVSTVKSILNHYIGVPPTEVTVDGKKMTPQEYLNNVLKINPDDYVAVYSLLEKPYYKQVEYEVPDNWWHAKSYNNVSLDEFMQALKNAVKKGYTCAFGGDVSEPGYDSHAKAAVVPSFDIPSEYIDENAREFRFSNRTTTDDHGIHCVGYKEKDGKMWFLIKDSGSGSRNVEPKGYYFYSEDYVKLKMMYFFVHRSAVEDLLKKVEITSK